MKFTEEQLKTLSAYEDNFRTAVKAQWARNPGRHGLHVIYDIFTQATGDQRRFNDNCNHCILSLLTDCGKIYFQDQEEANKRKDEAKSVKLSEAAATPVKKAPVRTAKKPTKKAKK